MRRAAAAVALLLLAALPATAAADDYPVCSGDTSAAGLPQKPGEALRVGITPRVEAGQFVTPAATAKPEDVPKTMAALARLRPAGGPFVVRLNRFFWSDGEAAFTQFLAEARRYSDAGYEVELQVRYRPPSGQEGDMAAWTNHVREVVDRFGAIPGVMALQITNEVNLDFSADSSDGAYAGGKDALIQGVIAAKDEARRKGMTQLAIGFNWAYRNDPSHEKGFWDYLRDNGGSPFVAALDWVGLDAYPGTVFPPAEQSVDDYRDGMVNGMSSFRCYLRAAGIPDSVPMQIEENGWPTFGARSEDMQAKVAEVMIRAASDFRGTYDVTDYRWFNLRDANSGDPAIAQHFGLLRDDYSEKPAFAVVAKLFAELGRKYAAGMPGTRGSDGCLRRTGAVRRSGIGAVRLGSRRADVIRRLGAPTGQTASRLRYCVKGGGKLLMAFDRRGRLRLVASTSFSTRVRGLRTGSSLRHVKHVYPHARWIGKRLLRANRRSRVVFGSCSCGSVAFVAVTNAHSAAKVRYWVKRVGTPRAAAVAASARPKFPPTVSGTISGTYSASRGGTTNKENWTIKGVHFRLEHVRFVENTWTGFYRVTGGTVTFSESESGPCSYSLEKTFALRPAMPKRAISTPFFLERNMRGKDSYGGNIVPAIHWNVTETCTYPDGSEPTTETKRIEPGNLFDSDSPGSFRIGRVMKGSYSYRDDYLKATTVFKWSLKPAR